MEKLYTDIEYTNKSIEANEQGKFLYQYIHTVEYQAEVLEWNYIEVEEERQKIDPETGLPMYDEEGNPIMETVIVQKAIPKMVAETVIDPETGEEKTIIVQAHHTETFTKEVVELLIDDVFKYLIFDGNYTRCESNPEGLSIAKAKKHAENTTKAQQAIYNGYVIFKEAQFETNTQTCSDLTSTILLMQASGLESYNWLSKDDKIVTLTIDDFGSLGALIADYKNQVWNVKYLDFKSQIEQASTIEEVEEIEIDYDLPEILKEIE